MAFETKFWYCYIQKQIQFLCLYIQKMIINASTIRYCGESVQIIKQCPSTRALYEAVPLYPGILSSSAPLPGHYIKQCPSNRTLYQAVPLYPGIISSSAPLPRHYIKQCSSTRALYQAVPLYPGIISSSAPLPGHYIKQCPSTRTLYQAVPLFLVIISSSAALFPGIISSSAPLPGHYIKQCHYNHGHYITPGLTPHLSSKRLSTISEKRKSYIVYMQHPPY